MFGYKDFRLSLGCVQAVLKSADWFLRVYIDKPDGIDIVTDCRIPQKADKFCLTSFGPIEVYCLEVCSPGLSEFVRKVFGVHLSALNKVKNAPGPSLGIGRESRALWMLTITAR